MVALIESQAEQLGALKAAVASLEGRLALRSELGAIVAAEVSSPLGKLARLLDALRELGPTEPGLQLVEEAAFHLDQLDAAVREASAPQGTGGPAAVGRARLRQVDVGGLVERAVASVRAPLDPSRVSVFGGGLTVTTSPPRLVALLVNLLDNAARHGGPGPVECRAALRPDGTLALWVADRGPGLRGADPEVLFEPFVRGSAPGRAAGRGIGLYLVRMLAHSLGGEARLAERASGGVVAAVDLPQRRGSEAHLSLDE